MLPAYSCGFKFQAAVLAVYAERFMSVSSCACALVSAPCSLPAAYHPLVLAEITLLSGVWILAYLCYPVSQWKCSLTRLDVPLPTCKMNAFFIPNKLDSMLTSTCSLLFVSSVMGQEVKMSLIGYRFKKNI